MILPTSISLISKLTLQAAPKLFAILEQKVLSASQIDLLNNRQNELEMQLNANESALRLSTFIANSGESVEFEKFLESTEFNSFLLEVLAVVHLPEWDNQLLKEQLMRRLLEGGVTENKNLALSIAENLVEMAVDASSVTWGLALECGIVNPQDLAVSVNRQLIFDTYSALKYQLQKTTVLSKDEFQAYQQFRLKYRSMVGASIKYIRHPSLEGSISFDALYVPPDLHLKNTRSKPEPDQTLSPSDAFLVSYRSVVLGNPGAGKSTFATKLCHDLWSKPLTTQYGARNVVPILIVLRDYAAQAKDKPQSFLEYVEAKCKVDFQFSPPAGAFEKLCLCADAVVIFDGLDELLDTRDRREITKSVESFAMNYPAIPILVTSRERGYEQAPLDPERFAVFNLLPFNEEQVRQYVYRWFRYSCIGSEAVTNARAEAFMSESVSISDLRENPLMLALLCNLYRQDGYLPQFRPDVYQRCADLLFERWDKSRQIKSGLSVEYHLKPIMRHLAQWIYCSKELQKGVTESQLLQEISSYLSPFTDSPAQAASYAQEFVDFLKGRAWVFSDTGSNENERLYTFTHRTFLEYFTADYLVGACQGALPLSARLVPHIEKQEWDTVCQLCYQMQARQYLDAADQLVSELLHSAALSDSEMGRLNLLLFTSRVLKLIHPRTEIRTKAVQQIVNCLMGDFTKIKASVDYESPESVEDDTRDNIIDAIVSLESYGSPQVAIHAMQAAQLIADKNDDYEDFFLLLECFRTAATFPTAFEPRSSFTTERWVEAIKEKEASLSMHIENIERRNLQYALARVWNSQLTVEQLVELHGRIGLLVARRNGFKSTYWIPILPSLAMELMTETNNLALRYNTENISRLLVEEPLPFADAGHLGPFIDVSVVMHSKSDVNWPTSDPSACTIAAVASLVSSQRRYTPREPKELGIIRELTKQRGSLSVEGALNQVKLLGLDDAGAKAVLAWALGGPEFVIRKVEAKPLHK